jgi:hypothetical protein
MAGMLLVNWLANSILFVTKKERQEAEEQKKKAHLLYTKTFWDILRGLPSRHRRDLEIAIEIFDRQ